MSTLSTDRLYHIAAFGTREGQWVPCNARKNICRMSHHISHSQLLGAQAWLRDIRGERIALAKITVEDTLAYRKLDADVRNRWVSNIKPRRSRAAKTTQEV